MNGCSSRVLGERRTVRNAASNLLQARRLRLLLERADLSVLGEAEDAHLRRRVRIDRLRRDRDVGLLRFVRVDELAVVHPIQMVAGEDEIVVSLVLGEVAGRLAHRIRRALIPVRIVRRLLSREDFDEPAREDVQSIGIRNVAVERGRIELRQHVDSPDVGVQAAADRDVDQSVFAADRDRRLGTPGGQWKEPGARSSAEDDGDRVAGHSLHGPPCKSSAGHRSEGEATHRRSPRVTPGKVDATSAVRATAKVGSQVALCSGS